MTNKSDWLYQIGLLETLNFCHEHKLHWFLTLKNNKLVYSIYFTEDMLPIYKRLESPT